MTTLLVYYLHSKYRYMDIIKFSIENPVKVTVAVLMTVLFGLIALYETPVQLTPDVEEPKITVTTVWPGASAQEIEREIIEEQEEQLKSVEGMRELKSECAPGMGTITMKFPVGVNLSDARARVADKLNQVPQYPEDAQEPVISSVDQNANAIAWYILKPLPPTQDQLTACVAEFPHLEEPLAPLRNGEIQPDVAEINRLARTYPELKALIWGKNDPGQMRKFAEDIIEARFERIGGVANSNVFGGQTQEFHIIVHPHKLAANHLTIAQVRLALDQQNTNTSGGDIWEGKSKNVVRILGQFETPEEVANTIIATRENKHIRVSDVADVKLSYKKPDGVVRQQGLSALAINAQQAPGTNVLEIIGPDFAEFDTNHDGEIAPLEIAAIQKKHGDSLRVAAAELNNGILQQQGVVLQEVYNQSEYINSATGLVQGNIVVGGTLAVLILLLFLRNLRTVLLIGLAIPISVIATFLFVRAFGRTINVISLAGMAFAVGMVVDNAIVVIENIYRHYQTGLEPKEATERGTREVWGAVLASTLTTLAVFIPVIFISGQAGQLFRDISIAITCAVGLSLVVSMTVVPCAASRILRSRKGNGKPVAAGDDLDAPPETGILGFFTRIGTAGVNFLADSIDRLQTMPGSWFVRLGIVILFIVGSLWGARILEPQKEYLPQGNRNLVFAILIPPPGYNVDKMIELGEMVEADLAPYWEAQPGTPEYAALEGPAIQNFFFVARGNMVFMGAAAKDPLRAKELVPIIQQAAAKAPGVIAVAQQSSLFESSINGGRTIDIEITGPDLVTLCEEATELFGMTMGEFPMLEGNQMRPMPALDLTSPEIHIRPRRENAAEMGVTASDLGYSVNALVDGAYAGDYWHQGDKIDLIIYGADEFARHSQDIRALPISTPEGDLVRLDSVADVTVTSGPDQVNHSERVRTITVQLTPAPNIPLEEAMERVDSKIRPAMMERENFQSGQYQIRLAGTADRLEETRIEMQWNLLLAMIITYMLMAGLFESFSYPLVIMISVALALVGGYGGLFILNLFSYQALDMLTMLGFIILIGTVVNNAILIVHQALNYMQEEGLTDKAAIVKSTRTRVRPIFMTTLTTVLGMLPLVLPNPSFSDGQLVWVSGAGSELYRGLGSVVLGGLIVSTVFTLVLIPIGFSLFLDTQHFLARLFGRGPAPQLALANGSAPLHQPSLTRTRQDLALSDVSDSESDLELLSQLQAAGNDRDLLSDLDLNAQDSPPSNIHRDETY